MTASTSKLRDPSTTWVITLKSNGMRYPNWGGKSAASVLSVASDYLKQPINNLKIQRQMEWS